MAQLACRTLWDMGYRMTFAEIEVSDERLCAQAPEVTRTLLWQDLDQAPNFPVLNSYLDHWRTQQSGVIASIKIAVMDGVDPDMLATQSISLGIH
jgi:uncharacterized protein Usg